MQNNFTSLNGSIHSLFNQRFSFKHLAALVASVLVILCAVWLPYALFWQLDGLLSLQQAQIIGSTMFYGGIASFIVVAVVTRFRLSKDWSLKRNVGLFSILLLTTLVFSSLLSAPVVAALTPLPTDRGPNNSSAFKFSVPFTEYQWVVAQFRDGTYYAINGSDWNIMTIVEPWQPVAPWAALAENKTALVEQVLSVTDPGKVLLNELSFDYGLVVPENVTVVESLNGLTRQFINSANTQGSPYTISVDTVNPTYYLAQDSADRYINEWSSTDATTVIDAAASIEGSKILIKSGNYSELSTITPANKTWIDGEVSGGGVTLVAKSSLNAPVISYTNNYGCKLTNVYIDGNGANQTAETNCLRFQSNSGLPTNSYGIEVSSCTFINGWYTDVYLGSIYGNQINFHDNTVRSSLVGKTFFGLYAVSGEGFFANNIITGNFGVAMAFYSGTGNQIVNNYVGYAKNTNFAGIGQFGWSLYLAGTSYNIFSNNIFCGSDRVGVMIDDNAGAYSYGNNFNGGLIHDNGVDTAYADRCNVWIRGHSANNTLNGVNIGNTVNNQNWAQVGVKESGNTDMNFVTGGTFVYIATPFTLIGTNSAATNNMLNGTYTAVSYPYP